MSRTAESPLSASMCASHARPVARLHVRHPLVERCPQVPGDRDVDAHVLVQLGPIDVDVDLLARCGA